MNIYKVESVFEGECVVEDSLCAFKGFYWCIRLIWELFHELSFKNNN